MRVQNILGRVWTKNTDYAIIVPSAKRTEEERMYPFMKKICTILLAMVLLGSAGTALADLEQNALLDAAFSAIEQDNIFQRRYNELTGSHVVSLFEQGIPYFFGGQVNYNGKLVNDKLLMEDYPLYAREKCAETTKFFRTGQLYIYGFDCSGFTKWIRVKSGLKEHPGLQDMIIKHDQWQYHLYHGGTNWTSAELPMPAYDELKDHLQVGDLLVTKHSARHIMMYIGTLADYGFTAEEAPELAAYLDYPLVIHCGPSPVYGERFQQVIDADPDRYGRCKTTNGGVEVSILGVKPEDAPYHTSVQNVDYDYFLIDGGNYLLTLRDIENASSFCWYRMP